MSKSGLKLEWKDDQSFWLAMMSKNKDGVLENNGFVRV
jgi:hypothetical protein